MGVCGSKKNRTLMRLGTRSSSSGNSSNSSLFDFSGDLCLEELREMNRSDLFDTHIKAPPNILSPSSTPECGYLAPYIPPRFQNGVSVDCDLSYSLADGPIQCTVLIHGFIRGAMHSITNTTLIPRCILSTVRLYYFPQHMVMELGASTDSFYTNFKMSHNLSSPRGIALNGTTDDMLLCTRNCSIYHSKQQHTRRYQAISFFEAKKEKMELLSHGISNRHCFIVCSTPSHGKVKGDGDLTLSGAEQHIYCIGHNQFGQCGTGCNEKVDGWNEITPSLIDTNCHVFRDTVKDIRCGLYHTLFLTANGNVWSCGQNWNGQLGLPEPTRMSNEPQLVHFAPIKTKHCITPMSSTTNVFSPGNCHIHLDDVDEYSTTMTALSHMDHHDAMWKMEESVRIKSISCGDAHNLCIDEHGELWVFGHMAVHQEMKESVFEAIKHPFFEKKSSSGNDEESHEEEMGNIHCIEASCGGDHSAVCDSNGIVYLFGSNEKGQSGTRCQGMQYEPYVFQNAKALEEVDGVNQIVKVVNVECGKDHTVLLTSMNEVITFGWNAHGQCSTVDDSEIVHVGHVLKRYEELGITQDTYIERVIASATKTVVVVNMTQKLKMIR